MSGRMLAAVVFVIAVASAQSDSGRDTASGRVPFLPNGGAELRLPSPSFQLPLTFVLSAPQSSPNLPLYQSFAGVPSMYAWEQQAAPDLTGPLKLQLLESGGEKAFRISLSAASTGGALFLAYRYLKRNGLH